MCSQPSSQQRPRLATYLSSRNVPLIPGEMLTSHKSKRAADLSGYSRSKEEQIETGNTCSNLFHLDILTPARQISILDLRWRGNMSHFFLFTTGNSPIKCDFKATPALPRLRSVVHIFHSCGGLTPGVSFFSHLMRISFSL
jgi:hypothetical protein